MQAAGVTLIPLHGTRNLPGILDSEFALKLGIKTGVLTDNTDTATVRERTKRQTEEKNILRLIDNRKAQGLPLQHLSAKARRTFSSHFPPMPSVTT